MEKFKKFFTKYVTYEPGNDYSGNGSIIKYDATVLLSWGYIVPFRGSIFRTPTVEGLVIGVGAATALAFLKCGSQRKGFCIPLPVGFQNLTLLTVASFLIGLFANTLLQRWWALRFHMHGHIGTNNEIIILASTITSNSILAKESIEHACEAKQACFAIYRYLNLANHLVVMSARKDFDYTILVNKGLVTQSELSVLKKLAGSPNIAYSWIDSRIQKLAHAGFLGTNGIAQANLTVLLTAVGAARSNCIAVGVYIDTQLPYPFVQLIAFVVNGCIIQAILVAGGTVGDALQKRDYDTVFSGYLSLILFIAVMRSLLAIYPILANPLGDDCADLPRTTYLNAAERGMMSLMNNIFQVSLSPEEDAHLKYVLDENRTPNSTSLHFPLVPVVDSIPKSSHHEHHKPIVNRGTSFARELDSYFANKEKVRGNNSLCCYRSSAVKAGPLPRPLPRRQLSSDNDIGGGDTGGGGGGSSGGGGGGSGGGGSGDGNIEELIVDSLPRPYERHQRQRRYVSPTNTTTNTATNTTTNTTATYSNTCAAGATASESDIADTAAVLKFNEGDD